MSKRISNEGRVTVIGNKSQLEGDQFGGDPGAKLAALVAAAANERGLGASRVRQLLGALGPDRISSSIYAGLSAEVIAEARGVLVAALPENSTNVFERSIARRELAEEAARKTPPPPAKPAGSDDFSQLLVWAQTLGGVPCLEVSLSRRRKDGRLGGFFAPDSLGQRGSTTARVSTAEHCSAAIRAQAQTGRDGAAELYARAPRGEPHRLLLLDDIPASVALALPNSLARAVIETSTRNCQVLLIAPVALSESERLLAQRALVTRVGGDPGSTSGDHWHRCPGSFNTKPTRLDASGMPFVTRLLLAVGGESAPGEWLAGGGTKPASVSAPQVHQQRSPAAPAAPPTAATDRSPSETDLHWAWDQSRADRPLRETLAALEEMARARGKSNPTLYAELTLEAVIVSQRRWRKSLRPRASCAREGSGGRV